LILLLFVVQTLKRLESKMSSENSYKNYREALRTALPPIVPYMYFHFSSTKYSSKH
jgi:hypothetical protein